ncbi:MAG: zinc metallopeptidase [Motiliproteus sp.]|nr:zinc metallopeptidase [Motiliproteus sp.]MCW9052647.1 zinc metallopeptidase [Motiliproteus sp.]
MDLLISMLAFALMLAAPKIWARYIFYKHSIQRKDIPGTGGQLVTHLLRRLKLARVKLKRARYRSHYNSTAKSVCLTEQTMNTRSLTAVVRAAFEVGHAMQDAKDASLLRFREGVLRLARLGEQVGSGAFLSAPLIALVFPPFAMLLIFIAVVSMLTGAAVHLMLLPIEWKAGFLFAMPLLNEGSYIREEDKPAVRQLLIACAFSRLAYAMGNLLDGRHWLRVLGMKWRRKD